MRKIDGETVHDATTSLRVNITKQDIERGAPMNPNACAIARACRREVDGCEDVFVHLGRVYIKRNGKWRRWQTPEYATREIVAYDRGGKFVPQEIDLRPPPVAQVIKRSRGARVSSPNRRKRIVHRTTEVRDSAHANIPPSPKK